MAEEKTTYAFETRGAKTAANQMSAVRKELHATSRHTQDLTSKVSGLAGGSAALGTVISQVNPALGAFGGVLGTAGSAVGGLATAIGGVGGLVGGGLVAALGLYVVHQRNATKEAEEAEKALQSQRKSVEELAAEYRKLGQSQTQAQLTAVNRLLEFGHLTEQGPQRLRSGERERLEIQRRLLQDRRARERNEELLAEIDAAAAGLESQKDAKPADRGGGITASGVAEFTAQKSALDQALADAEQRQQMLTRIAKVESDRRVEIAKNAAEEEVEIQIHALEAASRARRQDTEDYLARSQQLRQEQQMVTSMGIQATQGLAGSAIQLAQAVAKGQEITGAAVLEMIGDQLVAMGSMWIFQGIAKSILLNPQGPALLGVGGAAVAFGLGLGATASAASAGGGGVPTAPVRPTSGQGGGSPERGDRQTVIYVDALQPDDESVMRLASATRATVRRRGQRVARFAS